VQNKTPQDTILGVFSDSAMENAVGRAHGAGCNLRYTVTGARP